MKITLSLFLLLFSVSSRAQNLLSIPSQNEAKNASADGEDSSRLVGHVYHVNAWGSIAITAAGTAASLATYSFINNKPDITNQEFDALQLQSNKDAINALDRLSLNMKMP